MWRGWRWLVLFQLRLLLRVTARGASLGNQRFDYDEELARLSVIYSSAAYDRNPAVGNWTFVNPVCNDRTQDFILNETYTGEGTEAFGYVGLDPVAERIVTAFKGTSDVRDWMTDLRTWIRYSKRCSPAPNSNAYLRAAASPEGEGEGQDELIGNVHFGFCAYYQSVVAEGLPDRVALLAKENPTYSVHVTGHSLGGAAAAVCAADLTQRMLIEEERVVLYTFGEPRTGDGVFAEGLNDRVGTSYRVVHNRDIVPHLSICCHGWFGKCEAGVVSCPYQHATEIVYANDMGPGAEWLVCNDTIGEDYACDPQDWDLSVADHQHYFEIPVGDYCATAPENATPYPVAKAQEQVRWAPYDAAMRREDAAYRAGRTGYAGTERRGVEPWPLIEWGSGDVDIVAVAA